MNEQNSLSSGQQSELLYAMKELIESNEQSTRAMLLLASAIREQSESIQMMIAAEGMDEGEYYGTLDQP